LRNLIERIAILQPDSKEKISNIIKESLKNDNFQDKITENSLSVPLKEAREKFEKEYLTVQLKKFNGNISKTANFVGMERSALHRKLKRTRNKRIQLNEHNHLWRRQGRFYYRKVIE
jgi:two-component system nitrogen regulation response regulator NtrX